MTFDGFSPAWPISSTGNVLAPQPAFGTAATGQTSQTSYSGNQIRRGAWGIIYIRSEEFILFTNLYLVAATVATLQKQKLLILLVS